MPEETSSRGKGPLVLAILGVVAVAGVVAAVTTRGAKTVSAIVPSGTRVVAALTGTISTESARVGDQVTLETREPIDLEGAAPIPAGVRFTGSITHAKGGGRVAGAPELTIRVDRLAVAGEAYPIATTPFRFRGKNDAAESAIEIAGGAVVGAIAGEVLDDAALEGAVIGAAAGTVLAVATKGDQIVLPRGMRLRIRLTEPVTVTYRPATDAPAKDDRP